VAGPSGIDPEIMDTLVAAFEAAIQNQEHIDELANQGLQVDYKPPDEYQELLQRDEQKVRELGDQFIW
jgi:tripartite-type tricarboxylate transporter receptor subunit TctC